MSVIELTTAKIKALEMMSNYPPSSPKIKKEIGSKNLAALVHTEI